MKNQRKNGFVLVLVIVAMAIIGVTMLVLSTGANTMVFQSNTAYLQACQRNLVASGLAWAKQQIKSRSKENLDRAIDLDVTEMDIRGSTLAVFIRIPTDKQPEVQINTSCSRARRTLRHDDKYRIEL
jgi:type II secretory pathway pseudopilin PulG